MGTHRGISVSPRQISSRSGRRATECDDFRREYLTELVADLRAAAIDVAADQLDLWRAGKACDEQRRVSVLALVAKLRAQS
ncbi:hypothetical protein [Mycolicibacterium smegmatis]|uniref:hypothetical protein n=1 Tax=Mycolicibacterium smegmatis TaxID=1772 RepID=UPI000AF0E06C|nr:hypothetical protein [Mycolicibacterium smegmatis]